VRILLWQAFSICTASTFAIALTVGGSLVGVVTFGTTVGSLPPFLLRRLGSIRQRLRPVLATLVDVTGPVIYFSVASVVLRGALL
jgi:magnesium transporter